MKKNFIIVCEYKNERWATPPLTQAQAGQVLEYARCNTKLIELKKGDQFCNNCFVVIPEDAELVIIKGKEVCEGCAEYA